MPENAESLDESILDIIQKGFDRYNNDTDFNSLALRLFRYQHLNNIPYQRYCENIGVSRTSSIQHWTQIPFIPASSFRETALASFPFHKASLVFHTSGTTRSRPGRLFMDHPRLYDASLEKNFIHHLNIRHRPWEFVILIPSFEECRHSSLSYMASYLNRIAGKRKNPFYLKRNQILYASLYKQLQKLTDRQEPVLILATAFSLVHVLDNMRVKKMKFHCAPGSRLMETGGFKGLSSEISKMELYEKIHEYLSIPPAFVTNEYGMTEMASQFYDNSIFHPKSLKKRYHRAPPWVRSRVLNPSNLQECPVGEMGLLQHFDLANRCNIIGILTEDLAIRKHDGFQLMGRVPSQKTRGCSIGFEEWIQMK